VEAAAPVQRVLARAAAILAHTRAILLDPAARGETQCWAQMAAAWANLAAIAGEDPEPLPRCAEYLAQAERALAHSHPDPPAPPSPSTAG